MRVEALPGCLQVYSLYSLKLNAVAVDSLTSTTGAGLLQRQRQLDAITPNNSIFGFMLPGTILPAYIFRQQMIINIIVIIICIALILFVSIRYLKKIRAVQSKSQYIGKIILGLTLIFLVYFLLFFPELKKTFDLRSNGVVTMGKTVRWINTGDARMIEYSFHVDGLIYTKQCDVVYNGQEIENIQCPDGVYKVIYDSLDPRNSIMDLKSPGK